MRLDLVDLSFDVVKSNGNKETLQFKVADFPGQDRTVDWDVAHLYTDGWQLDGVVIMFDLSSPVSFRNVSEWIKRVRELTEAPILLVGNKADLVQGRKISPNKIGTFMGSDLYKQNIEHYYEVSALNNFNYEKSFLWFARHFTDDKTLQYA